MLKIGEFSKLSKITVKALRFYDTENILKPKDVCKWTGYRFYDNSQLIEAQKIVFLRQAGLSIAEIKKILNGIDPVEILINRQAQLEKEAMEANERFLRVKSLIESLKENKFMDFQATIKKMPECKVFYGVKKLPSVTQMGEFIESLMIEFKNSNPNVKCVMPDYCFAQYLDKEFTPVNATVLYAQAVESFGVETENVKFKTMPAVEMVSVLVKGEYMTNLPKGYAFAINWIEEHGYQIVDCPRECYIDGVWNGKSVENYLTEIQFPIKKK